MVRTRFALILYFSMDSVVLKHTWVWGWIHEYGVGFLVHKDVVDAVLGCRPVSSRLTSIRVRALLSISPSYRFRRDLKKNRYLEYSCLQICWLVGCFGFNGSLRQYFSLYRAVSQREGEREEKGQMRVKCPNNPHPHLLQAQQAPALL